MKTRIELRLLAAGVAALTIAAGCSQSETKLTKAEEKNFKGSRDMSAEAQQKMQEGMERMAKFNEELARKRQSQPPPNPAPQTGG